MADQSRLTEHLGQQVLESKEHRIWVGGALRTLDGEIPAELTGGRSWNGTTDHDPFDSNRRPLRLVD